MIVEIGKTKNGESIVGGVYAFYETHGVPLSDILFRLWNSYQRTLPDWERLIDDMTLAGRPRQRSIDTVSAAIADACYPVDIQEGIEFRLQKLL